MEYTREQLIMAQQKYNEKYLKSPTHQIECIVAGRECAKKQIDYLLSLIR